MKREEQDILQNAQLKNSPFNVPENYFSSLNKTLVEIPKKDKSTNLKKWVGYAAIAATFALLVAGSGMLLKWNDTDPYIAQELTEDDIIEYLIYTGVEVEDLEDLDLY